MESLIEHVIAIERAQARLEQKIDAVAEQVSRLCDRVEDHSLVLSQHVVQLDTMTERLASLEDTSSAHQSALDRAGGARMMLQVVAAFLGAVFALLGEYLWRK